MKQIQKKLIDIFIESRKIFEAYGDANLIGSHRLLEERITNPQSYVTLIGKTSSGKSTLINGFYQRNLIPTSASPTTGSITQIDNESNSVEEYFALNKDGTIEKIHYSVFTDLSKKPDNNLSRLLVKISPINAEHNGLNLFDTPGYDSLIAEHEEILRTFITESDVIIYVVNYRTGFDNQDQLLLSSIQDYINAENIPLYLVINRCPKTEDNDSKRVLEISSNASDTLHRKLEPMLVYSQTQSDIENPLPVLPQIQYLWDKVMYDVLSEERLNNIFKRGKFYLHKLFEELENNLKQKILIAKLESAELEKLKKTLKEFFLSKEDLIDILNKYCQRWERTIPKIIDQAFSEVLDSVESNIYNTNKWLDSNSCGAFILGHHLPYNIRKVSKNIEDYLKIELEEMDKEMDAAANLAIQRLSKSTISIPSITYSDIIKRLVSKIGSKLAGEAAKDILIGLGGRGGTAAGIGNLVKMGVKRFGRIFSRTYSREVYTNIGRVFNKELVKKLNIVIAVIIEAGVFIYGAKTWQRKLFGKIKLELEKLKNEMSGNVTKELINNIKSENTNSITELYEEINSSIESDIEFSMHSDVSTHIIEMEKVVIELNTLKQKLGEIQWT